MYFKYDAKHLFIHLIFQSVNLQNNIQYKA